jgi:hypothetical protein
MAVAAIPVSSDLNLSWTPGTAAPLGSVTWPLIEELRFWPQLNAGMSIARIKRKVGTK